MPAGQGTRGESKADSDQPVTAPHPQSRSVVSPAAGFREAVERSAKDEQDALPRKHSSSTQAVMPHQLLQSSDEGQTMVCMPPPTPALHCLLCHLLLLGH